MSDFNIETVAIDSLRPHPRNYRSHPQAQIEHLEASLREYGWARNVVVASDGVILAGHGIVEAARRRGETTVPVHRLALKSTDPKAEKFMVLENEVSRLADDDDAQLAALLKGLADEGELLGTGYDGGDVEALLAELQAEESAQQHVEDPGAEEPPAEPVSKLGDVWLCGEHRVVCGDCTEEGAWDALMQGRKVHVVFTSPPYGAGFDYGDRSTDGRRENASLANGVAASLWAAMADNGRVALQLENFIVHKVTKERGFCALPWQLAMLEIGFAPMDFCIWDKGASGSTAWGSYMSASCPNLTGQCEGIYVFAKGDIHRDGPSEWQNGDEFQEAARNVWRVGTASNTEHPAVFPVKLVERALRFWSFTGDIVADPFLGSGTTLVAAEQLGRVCYGIEIEPRYVDVSVRRWCKATGRAATLESTGEPFPVGD
jgi:DNA modification methylase